MKILVVDAFPAGALEAMRALGHEVDYAPDTTPADLAGADSEVLVVRSTRVDAAALSSPGLSAVIRAGAGVNTIDLEAAEVAGVMVCNTPGMNADAVAELTLGLMIAIDRRIPDNVRDLRAGTWDKAKYSKAIGLKGRTLGIVGIGSIGKAVALRAQAFGMHLAAFHRPGGTPEKEAFYDDHEIRRFSTVEELAEVSDFLTVHVPAHPSTDGLLGESVLSRLRPGSVVLNLSRSSIVDEEALLRALDAQDLWAGLDVFEDEPSAKTGSIESTLAAHPRVYGTHHIGASTSQAQEAVADRVVAVLASLESGEVLHRVV